MGGRIKMMDKLKAELNKIRTQREDEAKMSAGFIQGYLQAINDIMNIIQKLEEEKNVSGDGNNHSQNR